MANIEQPSMTRTAEGLVRSKIERRDNFKHTESRKFERQNFQPSKFIEASRKNPCPICQKPDWCGVSGDGAIAVCMRVFDGSIRDARNGGFVHVLKERERKPWQKPIQAKASQSITPIIAPIDRRNAIYRALLESLTLSSRHGDDLLRRKLHDTFIANNLFASVPGESRAKIVCADLASRFDMRGVPGFFKQDGTWRLAVSDWCAGYFVPVRDLAGRIQALQIRRERGESRYTWLSSKEKPEGVTSGAPVHFAAPHRLAEGSTIITEGALKSDVIAQFTESAVIGLAGVNSYKPSFGVALKAAGVRIVRIAFDADWQSNPAVSRGLERLGLLLCDSGLTVSLLDWSLNEGKGLDDLLAKEVA